MTDMNTSKPNLHHKIDVIVTAFVFIAVGILLIGRNLGIVSWDVFHFLVSWQMLLVVIGIAQLMKRKIVGGAVLITIGTYFLLSRLSWIPSSSVLTFWPLILIFTGVLILTTRLNSSRRHKGLRDRHMKNVTSTEDGFVVSEVAFGSAKQIVFDPYFKGARLDNTFGGIVLDLRRTKLIEPETIIDIDSSFGGIEILVPENWNVQVNADTVLSGYHDKRTRLYEEDVDREHKLIIKGDLTFSGLEIKS